MKKYGYIVVACSVWLLGGCGNAVYDIMSRSQANPDNFEIDVRSFDKEREVICEWAADECCDEYILMRSKDGKEAELEFKEVYRGKKREYRDKYLLEDVKYLYRLDKVRGKVKFKGRQYYLGVFNGKRKDKHEPNDSEEQATLLDETRYSNVYYYRSYTGVFIEDEDWYEVEIPGFWKVFIKLTYDYGDLPFIVTFADDSRELHPSSTKGFAIENTSKEKMIKRFKVSLDKAVVGGGGVNVATFRTYTIQVLSYNGG